MLWCLRTSGEETSPCVRCTGAVALERTILGHEPQRVLDSHLAMFAAGNDRETVLSTVTRLLPVLLAGQTLAEVVDVLVGRLDPDTDQSVVELANTDAVTRGG